MSVDRDTVYSFDGEIDIYDMGRMVYKVIYFPDHILEQLPMKEYPRLRLEVDIEDIPANLAMQPQGGRWYLILSSEMMKKAELDFRKPVRIRFTIADQTYVEIPDILRQEIDRNKKLKIKRETLTPGKKRSFAHRVLSAKTDQTKFKRLKEVTSEVLKSDTESDP